MADGEKCRMSDFLIADIFAKQNFSFSLPALCEQWPMAKMSDGRCFDR